jgi:NodT family efflux transporter outer membrane factor (OMF) lipoprotein
MIRPLYRGIGLRPVQLSAIALVVFLSGCIGGGGIKPEAAVIDPASVDASAAMRAATNDAHWPTSEWWQKWHDPQLDRLITRAVADSPDLAIVQSRVTAAIWQAKALYANELPILDSSAQLQRERFAQNEYPIPPGGSSAWNNSAALDLSYDLDLWGKQRAIEQGALKNVHAALADAQFSKIELQTAVARTYNQLALQYALLDVYQSINDDEKHNVDIATKRRKAGIGTDIDLSQAKTQYQAGITDVIRTQNEIALERLQIAYLVGEGPGFGDSLSRPLPPGDVAEIIGHRPDVVAQRWRASAAAEEVHAAHADFYPNINLVANASLASLVPFGGFFNFLNTDNSLSHGVGFAASLPIFDAERRRGHYGVATAEYDDAVLKYNDTVLAAMQSVAQQVTTMRSLKDQQTSVEGALAASKRSYDLADQGYRGGITEYLDVLVAQKVMLQQEISLAQIQARRVDEWTLLIKDLGGGSDVMAMPSDVKAGGDDAR